MDFGSMPTDVDDEPIAAINMVPLIDVMLVLLIVFMVTAPLLTHAVKLDLPRAASAPTATPAAPVRLDIDASGALHWNGEAIDASALAPRLAEAARREPRPELLLRADRTTSYEVLAQLMSQAARAGLSRIGFLTDPRSAAD